ncbi:MAG: alpha-amylase, partial [Spirochaetaceae bacterium]|nr:alpha-amylase [Spirochaetaceae bacterium]
MDSRDFRISRRTRSKINIQDSLFSTDDKFNSYYLQAQEITYKYNNVKETDVPILSASNVNASAILHYIYQNIIDKYLKETNDKFFSNLTTSLKSDNEVENTLTFYSKEFPSPKLSEQFPSIDDFIIETTRGYFIHKVMSFNPAMIKAIKPLIAPDGVVFPKTEQALKDLLGGLKNNGIYNNSIKDDLFTFLITPSILNPDSLFDQIKFILDNWQNFLTDDLKNTLLKAIDHNKEETKPVYSDNNGGHSETYIPHY